MAAAEIAHFEPQAREPITRLESFANLSTGHVTNEVRAVLDKENYEPWVDQLVMMTREYGWFIHVPPLEHIPPQPANDSDVDAEGYWALPKCLRDCFDAARADGATWILFDQDECQNPDLPYFEW